MESPRRNPGVVGHSAAVGEHGSLFMWSQGAEGHLGVGNTARLIAAWGNRTGIVTDAGHLIVCGFGWCGQLELGHEGNRTTHTLEERVLFNGDAVLMVACVPHGGVEGGRRVCKLGEPGQLGPNDLEDQRTPRKVEVGRFGGKRFVALAAGEARTVALTTGWRLHFWGQGFFRGTGPERGGCQACV